MQSDLGDLSMPGKLLALNVMLEAARAGEAGREFSRLADELFELAHGDDETSTTKLAVDGPGAAKLDRQIETRRLQGEQGFRRIAELGAQINSVAQLATAALQFEDVEAGVVVYSKEQAERLRELVTRIEAGQRDLKAAIAADHREIDSIMDTFGGLLEAACTDR